MTTTAIKTSPVNMEARQKIGVQSGDVVSVSLKIQEKGKTRIQKFEGLAIAVKHGGEAGGTFTVRKVASGVGVEKIFPLYSPLIDKIEIVKRAKTKRSKLYYLREKTAKQIRRKMRKIVGLPEIVVEEDPIPSEADGLKPEPIPAEPAVVAEEPKAETPEETKNESEAEVKDTEEKQETPEEPKEEEKK